MLSTTTTTPTTMPSNATTTMATATATTMTATRTRATTVSSDPGILCFHHCNVKVFCFTLPHTCPQCKAELDTSLCGRRGGSGNGGGGGSRETDADADGNGFGASPITTRLLPFRLPYPFVRAAQYPCAIVLRPTTGDFLNDYNNTTDLHIAVTTSTGCVVEFDRHGLRRHRTDNMPEWWQCLLVGDVPEPWYDYWDEMLLQVCQQPGRWSVSHYDEETHNCYTFVLAFLQSLSYDKLSEAARSKTSFCEKYIVPRTTTAGKYISLYRKLRDAGVYVHHITHRPTKGRSLSTAAHNKLYKSSLPPPSTATAKAAADNSNSALATSQHQHQHQHQHSIMARPHSTLCTIEE